MISFYSINSAYRVACNVNLQVDFPFILVKGYDLKKCHIFNRFDRKFVNYFLCKTFTGDSPWLELHSVKVFVLLR